MKAKRFFLYKQNNRNENPVKNRGFQRTAAVLLAGMLGLSSLLSGCGAAGEPAEAQEDVQMDAQEETPAYETGVLSMGTGEESSMVHMAGIAVAGVINNTVPGIHVAVETTKGAMINAVNVSEGDLDLAMIAGDVAYDAYNGLFGFDGKLEDLRVLGACYQEVSGWMALKSSGLETVRDLNGKIISSGPKASATELASDLVFDVLEIDREKSEIYSDSFSASAEHIKRETADAVHAFSTVPNRVHEELASGYETVVLSYEEEDLNRIQELDERYFKTEIPAGTYNGQTEPVPTFGIKVLLCADEDMDEDLAYEIARALDLNGPVYTGGHRFMAAMQEKPFLCNELPIPLHEGAEAYYREAGFIED